MRWMLLRFLFSFLTFRMYLSRLQSILVFNNTNQFFCVRKARARVRVCEYHSLFYFMFVFNVWMCSIHILFALKRSYMITFRNLHVRNFFTSHCLLWVFCVRIVCIIMYEWICVDCIVSRVLKSSLSCLWLYAWISFCVCSRIPVCRITLCVRAHLNVYWVVWEWSRGFILFCTLACAFITLVVCMNVCIVFCVFFACVVSCCLCVHIMAWWRILRGVSVVVRVQMTNVCVN